MAIDLPSDFLQRATEVFLSESRRNDPAASFALSVFLAKAGASFSTLKHARRKLGDSDGISEFIEEVRRDRINADIQHRQAFEKEAVDFLTRINTNVLTALSGQGELHSAFTSLMGEMRSDFKGVLAEMHIESKAMIGQLQSESKQAIGAVHVELSKINGVAEGLKKSSRDIDERTVNIFTTINDTVLPNMQEMLRKASIKTAIIAGCASGFVISCFPGFPLNVGANYLYERYLSVAALNKAAPSSLSVGGALSLPAPESSQKDQTPDLSIWKLNSKGLLRDLQTGQVPDVMNTGKILLFIEPAPVYLKQTPAPPSQKKCSGHKRPVSCCAKRTATGPH